MGWLMARADGPRVHIGDVGTRRGPVRDFLGKGPGGLAWCVCDHGKEWPEGDRFEPEGAACRECSVASLEAFRNGQG
jgi:hypothetical protein